MLVETQEIVARRPSRLVGETQAERWWTSPLSDGMKFAAILLQLVLLAVVIKRYNLESPAFYRVTLLVVGGFVVHYFLPLAYRMRFFLALSLASIVIVMGPAPAAWLIALGVGLVGLCHLPLPFWTRIALLTVAAALLSAMRGGWWLPDVVPVAIWPILGSMFVFRMTVYLYDIYHKRLPKTVSESLSYFFMLPNVCFPLFPIVDFTAFTRRYYNADRHDIYRVGVHWIFRGAVHLILYRILYMDWGIGLYDVENMGDLAHYCLWSFLLYLRVSGQFHIIVGMLHLFGFNLAETHHLYYLSSSFTDFWRRINIYWKDFMMKIFFYPVYFRIKSAGPTVALVVSTVTVFVVTWALHSLQWFWLRGAFLWAPNDILFWTILTVLVVINSLWEVRRSGKASATLGQMSWSAALIVALKTLGTFAVICTLWSLWTSESISAWLSLWPFALVPPTKSGGLLIVLSIATILGCATLVARNPSGFAWNKLSFLNESVVNTVGIVLVLALSVSVVNRQLGAAGKMIAATRQPMLNRMEMQQMERGYYENLLAVDRFNGDLWSLYSKRPKEWTASVLEAGLATPTDDMLRYELKPSAAGQYRGAVLRTNKLGMHDCKDYSIEPSAGCYRIAMIGASHSMGLGVEATQTFETLIEDRLNREHGKADRSYDFLNFSVTGYEPIRQIVLLQKKVFEFKPKMVIYAGHHGDADRCVHEMIQAVSDRIQMPDPYLRELVGKVGIDAETPLPLMRRKLRPHTDELLSWVFGRIVGMCREHGAEPCYILLPLAPGQKNNPAEVGPDLELARQSGFRVIDLSDAYDNHAWQSLWISEFDTHPNVLGHQLLGQRLYTRLLEQKVIPVD